MPPPNPPVPPNKLTPGEVVSLTPGPDPKERLRAESQAAPAIDLADVVDDPYFHSLPLDEKHKVAMQDPHYKNNMSAKQQAEFLNLVHYGPEGTAEERKQKGIAEHERYKAREITSAIPAVAGLGGALAGAPAGPAGTVAGAGLGAAAGESLQQAYMHSWFPDEEPSPVSKEGVRDTLVAGAVSAAAELPAAFAQGYGRYALRRLATAKSSKEVGDVIDAFNDVHPFRFTKGGLEESLESAKQKLNNQLTPIFKASTGTSDLDQLLQGARARATQEDVAFARTTQKTSAKGVTSTKTTSAQRVSNALNDVIAAAKSRAGIKQGVPATAQQLANFQREIQQIAFESKRADPTVGGVVHRIAKDMYGTVGKEVDALAPPARPLLDRATDIHAALSALKRSNVGPIRATSISAALHPRAAAALSPVAPLTATEIYRRGRDLFRNPF